MPWRQLHISEAKNYESGGDSFPPMQDPLDPDKPPNDSNIGSVVNDSIVSTDLEADSIHDSLGQSLNPDSDSDLDLDLDSLDDSLVDETLSSTILREIEDGTYTCLVCTGEIDRSCKVWSCDGCYRVYDLNCIKDWALRGSSTDKSSNSWRCPACNVAHTNIPSRFTCWCKRTNKPNPQLLVPFSCGNPCTFKYPDCVHMCSSSCHPGEHPVCGAVGPNMKCKCGKHSQQVPCLITPYKTGWMCNEPCDLPTCDLHKCKEGCHSGFCGPCEEIVNLRCYCGREIVLIPCKDKVLEQCGDKERTWIAAAGCTSTNKVYYDCGIHFEEMGCEPLPLEQPHCIYAPDSVTTCYCGKTTVDASLRTECTEPIPECESVCGQLMQCGCECNQKCHSGPCECHNIKEAKCGCGHHTFLVMCEFLSSGNIPKCTHKCSILLSCRKHYHRQVCCTDEQTALARERDKKKAIRNNTRSNFTDELMIIEPSHICTRLCLRLKPCGQHYCSALCHSGPCGTCYELSNDDLVCHCGKTVVEAPVRCGTKLDCHFQCMRATQCGHRAEVHECHDDQVPCPKCTVLVKKFCRCRSKELVGILCSQDSVSCGSICTVAKQCGHTCLRVCDVKCTVDHQHAPANECLVPCNKLRSSCPHRCALKCHFEKDGSSAACDDYVCKERITIKCECGFHSVSQPCGGSVNAPSRLGTMLECTDECEKAKRQEELRKAFSFEPIPSVKEGSTPYSALVLSTFSRQKAWCSRIEGTLRSFLANYREREHTANPPKRTLNFAAMLAPQREFIHALGESFKLYVESQDEEPNRRVFVVVTRLSRAPAISIGDALLLEQERLAKELEAAALLDTTNNSLNNAILIPNSIETLDIVASSLCSLAIEKSSFTDGQFARIGPDSHVFYSPESYMTMDVDSENALYVLMKAFKARIREAGVALECTLCVIDEKVQEIVRQETVAVFKEKYTPPTPAQISNNYQVLIEDEEEAFEAAKEAKKRVHDEGMGHDVGLATKVFEMPLSETVVDALDSPNKCNDSEINHVANGDLQGVSSADTNGNTDAAPNMVLESKDEAIAVNADEAIAVNADEAIAVNADEAIAVNADEAIASNTSSGIAETDSIN